MERNKAMNNWGRGKLEWAAIALFQLFMALFLFYRVAGAFVRLPVNSIRAPRTGKPLFAIISVRFCDKRYERADFCRHGKRIL